MIKAPKVYISKVFRKEVLLRKSKHSNSDDSYGQRLVTFASEQYPIKVELQEITSQDLSYYPSGVVNVGDANCYFMPTYLSRGKTVTVEVADEVSWNNKIWDVRELEDFYVGNSIYYKRGLLKRRI